MEGKCTFEIFIVLNLSNLNLLFYKFLSSLKHNKNNKFVEIVQTVNSTEEILELLCKSIIIWSYLKQTVSMFCFLQGRCYHSKSLLYYFETK